MGKKSRSGKTSTAAKKRYHDKVYTDLNVALPHAVYRQYRARCMADGVSMRSQLIDLIGGLLGVSSQAEIAAMQAEADERLFAAAKEAYEKMKKHRGY